MTLKNSTISKNKNVLTRLRIDPIVVGLLAFNALLFWVLFKYAGPHFETNDDFAMSAIASGFFGQSSSYIVFSNIIFGFILKTMFKLVPAYNWLVVSYYALMYMAYVGIGYVLLKKNKLLIGIMLYLTFVITFFYGTLVLMNFTRVSTLVLVSGYILFNHALNRSPERSRFMATCGAFLVVVGSFIRFDAFELVTAFVFVLLVLNTTQLIRRRDFARLKWRSLRWGILFSLVLFTYGFNIAMTQNAEIRNFMVYNTARAQVTDYDIPSYEDNKALFTELGVTKNDLRALQYWILADSKKITTALYNSIADVPKDPTSIRSYLRQTYDSVRSVFKSLVFSVLVSCYIGLLALKRNRYRIVVHLGLYSVFLAEIMYLVYIGRPIPRAVYSVALTLTVLVISSFEFETISKKSLLAILVLLTALGGSAYAFQRDLDHMKTYDRTIVSQENLMKNLNSTGKIYVWQTMKVDMVFKGYTLFEAPRYGEFANSLSIGGWITEMPIMNKKLRDMGITNVIESLITDKRVYYIGDRNMSLDVLLTYLKENYNPKTYFKVVDKIDDVVIYKFYIRR